MKVVCLTHQESLFETRRLKRMADPVFLSPAHLMEAQGAPLLLFGNWYETGLSEGLRWLSSVAYRLRLPGIVFPPFQEGPLGQILGLQVGLEAKALNRNRLTLKDEMMALASGRHELKVQADFGFIGPAGKPLVVDSEEGIATVVALQPKTTLTPLLLCGARIFSASGLSNEEDLQALFAGLVAWANGWQAQPIRLRGAEGKDAELSHETLKSLCVLLAGTRTTNPKELISLADAIWGVDLPCEELEAGLKYLSQNGFITIKDDSVLIHSGPLEQYVRELGLWSHVRILKRDFVKEDS